MRDVELYQQLLGVVSPWTVSRVELSVEIPAPVRTTTRPAAPIQARAVWCLIVMQGQ
jgi:hypothetical protein